ncbi:hypothetical protein HY947_02175 [Candidatus Gottesmanbacteria bacterium]|nr:hypothetical protein [Candidatus Gottesmanbacteria bacterium]
MNIQNIRLDKIASVLKNTKVGQVVKITNRIKPKIGIGVVVEALRSQDKYGEIELVGGRLSKIRKGDVIAGVFGERKALEGIVGHVPKIVSSGDTLQILNLGGLIGSAVSWNKDVIGTPLPVKFLGAIISENKILDIDDFTFRDTEEFSQSVPMIVVLGTAMSTGKTTVATELIHILAHQKKLKVCAAKLTGVAAQRDILGMKDAGAYEVLSFLDFGLTSTINQKEAVVPAAKAILNTLNMSKPDVIVAELGDGIIGWYGVDKLLAHKDFVRAVSFVIACAHDLVGAVGVTEILKKANLKVDFFAGPVSNNTAGSDYLKAEFGIPAEDVRDSSSILIQTLMEKKVIGL